jgi:hypothetical protein
MLPFILKKHYNYFQNISIDSAEDLGFFFEWRRLGGMRAILVRKRILSFVPDSIDSFWGLSCST